MMHEITKTTSHRVFIHSRIASILDYSAKSAVVLAAALCCPLAYAVTPEEALASKFRAAEALINAQLTKEAVPGAAIGVVYDQQLIWSYRFGVESLETGTPVTDDTVFSICSVSKLFNSVAAMNLVEHGRLSLDASVAGYLDGIGTQDETGSEEPVTVRNILSHVSGLPREGLPDYWADTVSRKGISSDRQTASDGPSSPTVSRRFHRRPALRPASTIWPDSCRGTSGYAKTAVRKFSRRRR